jgi:multisubunit Na+/H+ antiporter MnhG subunit
LHLDDKIMMYVEGQNLIIAQFILFTQPLGAHLLSSVNKNREILIDKVHTKNTCAATSYFLLPQFESLRFIFF